MFPRSVLRARHRLLHARLMQRRDLLRTVASAGVTLGLAGCSSTQTDSSPTEPSSDETTTEGESSTDTESSPQSKQSGVLATHVSDRPGDIDDFESLVVTISKIRVFPKKSAEKPTEDTTSTSTETANETQTQTTHNTTEAEGEEEKEEKEAGEGKPRTIVVEDAKADLTQLQGKKSKIVSDVKLKPQEFTRLELYISDVQAKLKDGGTPKVKIPSGRLKFNKPFDVRPQTVTNFTADFQPVKRGKTGSYNIQPVAKEVSVSYEEVEQSTTTESPTTTTESDSESPTNTTTATNETTNTTSTSTSSES